MKNILKRGFTLVELLVVVLIIGILSSVALPQYTKAVKKAKGVKITTAASALVKAMNMAYLEDGNYSRRYLSYTGEWNQLEGADDFDIEIPRLNMGASGEWWIWGDPNGSTARVLVANDLVGNDDRIELTYHLSQGKLGPITCSGSGCSQYFPRSMLSSN